MFNEQIKIIFFDGYQNVMHMMQALCGKFIMLGEEITTSHLTNLSYSLNFLGDD